MRIASLGVFFLSVAFTVVQRAGWLSKQRLLDVGHVLQVAIAFACGLFEGAAYKDPDAVVVGISAIAVWMMLCGRLMPNAPLKSAVTGNPLCRDVAAGLLGGLADYRISADARSPACWSGFCRW